MQVLQLGQGPGDLHYDASWNGAKKAPRHGQSQGSGHGLGRRGAMQEAQPVPAKGSGRGWGTEKITAAPAGKA